MKKALIILGLAMGAAVAHGQIQFPYVIYTTVDPTGNACSFGAPSYIVFTTGVFYDCKNGVYAAVGSSTVGTVTSVTGTANQIDVATGTTTPVISLDPSLIQPGAGAASISPLMFTGALETGGTGTTNFPHLFIQPTAATAATTWSTSGTHIGVNTATGFAGNFLDFHVNGASSVFKVGSTGIVSAGNAFVSIRADNEWYAATGAATGIFHFCNSSFSNCMTYNTSSQAMAAPQGITAGALVTGTKFNTATNCSVNSVSPAACGAASAGAFVVPTTTTTYTVNTTIVTATSRITLQPISFAADLPSTPTCVVPAITTPWTISAITAATSFTFTLPSTVGQTCWYYTITN